MARPLERPVSNLVDESRARKDPRYNAKKTIAVTERVLHTRCATSDAYLWNVENGQKRMIQLEHEVLQTGKLDGRVVFPHEAINPYAVVSYDNLEYGIEMTLKAAQMVDGYHGFNRDLDIPGFIENFEVGSLTYVYVLPTHRLDTMYNKYLSDVMKEALRNFLDLKELVGLLYEVLHPETMDLTWAPGTNHSAKEGRVRYDSKRYTSDWISTHLDPRVVLEILPPLRRLNRAIPAWFHDRELKARES